MQLFLLSSGSGFRFCQLRLIVGSNGFVPILRLFMVVSKKRLPVLMKSRPGFSDCQPMKEKHDENQTSLLMTAEVARQKFSKFRSLPVLLVSALAFVPFSAVGQS